MELEKEDNSDCWLERAQHKPSLANGVNCVVRAMRDEKDKTVLFIYFFVNGVALQLKAADW